MSYNKNMKEIQCTRCGKKFPPYSDRCPRCGIKVLYESEGETKDANGNPVVYDPKTKKLIRK